MTLTDTPVPTQGQPAATDRYLGRRPEPGTEHDLAHLATLPEGPERQRLRQRVIERHLPLARSLAGRFRQRGEPLDDLVQVAMLGLVKAVDGFDPERGLRFSSYAVPTIVGEVKRHFRDRGWDVRLPRPLQELVLDVRSVSDEFSQAHGRAPTVADLVDRLDVPAERVIEALAASAHYRSLSLDAPASLGDEDDPATLGDTLPDVGDASADVEDRLALRPLLQELPERERTILMLRFYGNHTQSAIAERLGISQMHVSRLLARTLADLRARMLDEPDGTGAHA